MVKLVDTTAAREAAREAEEEAGAECERQLQVADDRHAAAVAATTKRQDMDVMVINRVGLKLNFFVI